MWPSEKHRTELLARLRISGISKVIVHFQGGGDSGEIHLIECLDSQDQNVNVDDQNMDWEESTSTYSHDKGWVRNSTTVNKSFPKVLEQLTCNTLDEQGFDWYNNEGGQGRLTIDFSQTPPKIKLLCQLNIVMTEDHNVDLTDDPPPKWSHFSESEE